MLMDSIKTGLKKGIQTTLMLAKTIIPVFMVVTIIKNTPIIGWISSIFEPIMGIFNLPGEAAIVLVIGNVLNIYAGIGAIKAIELTGVQITVLAIMLSFSHSLIVESAITKQLGFKVSHGLIIRLGLAVASGILVGRVGALI